MCTYMATARQALTCTSCHTKQSAQILHHGLNAYPQASASYEELMQRTRKKQFRSRLTRSTLQIAEGLEIDVQVR